MEKGINLIQGGSHVDERGILIYFNELELDNVKRFYTISHPDTNIVRAWQGHKKESKWFHVVNGEFKIVIIVPDNWINPSLNLVPQVQVLTDYNNQVLYLPGGVVFGIQATKPNSKLIVFSDSSTEESKKDDYRFDKSLWYTWQ